MYLSSILLEICSHLFIFNTFRDMVQTKLPLQKLGRQMAVILLIELWFLHSALLLMNSINVFIQFPSILSEICSRQTKYYKIRKGSNSVNTSDWVMVQLFIIIVVLLLLLLLSVLLLLFIIIII